VFYFPVPIVFALLMNEMNSKGAQRLVQNVSYLPHSFRSWSSRR
jgi:ABC-type polysaccharide transport system permease subunit